MRPYARQALRNLAKHFEIVIFTASHPSYSDRVIDLLDPRGDIISYRLFRDSCIETKEKVLIKDLRIIRNRELKDLIIVDNSLYCYGYQINHGVPILPYYGNENDEELLELNNFLVGLGKEDIDVEGSIKDYFATELFKEHSMNQYDLITKLVELHGVN